MNEVKVLNKDAKFVHATVGSLHAFEGKQFVKDATGSTSCEISFGSLFPPEYQCLSSTATKPTRKTILSSVARANSKSTTKSSTLPKAL